MRQISDVIKKAMDNISKEEICRYFALDDLSNYKPLKVLYCFNVSGFYIPLKPSICDNSLDDIKGWIELAKEDRKIELHDNDGTPSQNGDVAFNDSDIYIITDNRNVKTFIRIPERYLYTSIHTNTVKKKTYKINLTGEDILMLEDSNNINEISICDSHEDGA